MRGGITSIWSFWIQITGRPAAWIVGIVFSIVDGLILLLGAALTSTAQDAGTALIAVRILGVVFFGLGILVLVAMVIDLVLLARGSPRQDAYFWWVNFLCGLFAAGLFSVPATLVFPLMLLAYLPRPNVFFTSSSHDDASNLFLGAPLHPFRIGRTGNNVLRRARGLPQATRSSGGDKNKIDLTNSCRYTLPCKFSRSANCRLGWFA